ncbi:MAG: DUF58 domain-containing protein [Candidatus Omnitrophica bacterium]|nr:DUF58 domain-containing protein [Candidatus Omnitrophota bacterium]
MKKQTDAQHAPWREFLDPARVNRICDLKLVARLVVEGFISGLHRSPYRGFSVEFAEHREYAPGDDPRSIDWKVWSRTDKYYVKEFEEETNLKACLVLDGSASMHYSSGGRPTKRNYACCVAAALGYLMIRQSDAVGLTVSGCCQPRYIPPRSNPTHLTALLKEMSRFQNEPPPKTDPENSFSLAAALHAVAERMKRRGLIVILSDLWDDPAEMINGLHHLNYRGHEAILFHIWDSSEWEFPFAGATTFVDAETGEQLPTDATLLRREYLRKAEDWRSMYSKACAQCRYDYVPVNTSTPFDRVLAGYLTRRAKLF